MFDSEYVFKGKHAEMVIKLTSSLDDRIGRGFFRYNYEVYRLAPIVGFLYKRKAPLDKGDATTKIFRDKMMDAADNSKYNYRLIMLLENKENIGIDEREKIAFKLDSNNEERAPYDALFDEYVRGGVEVLYEHLFNNAKTYDDYLMNLYNFLTDYNNRYYAEIGDVDEF